MVATEVKVGGGAEEPMKAEDEFANFVRQMSQLERELNYPGIGFSPTDAFRPAVNLYETATEFVVCVDLAGMDMRDMEVSLEKGVVVIRGRRQSPMPPDGAQAVAVHLMEIDHGNFCRTVEVPSTVEQGRIVANYHLGMLWVRLPKKK